MAQYKKCALLIIALPMEHPAEEKSTKNAENKRDDTGTVLPFGTFTVNRQNRPRVSLQQELLVL